MNEPTFIALFTAIHSLLRAPLRMTRADATESHSRAVIDRGAVSIEQVLWYAAAAVSVAVVAAIIWGQIKSTASTGVNTPSAP